MSHQRYSYLGLIIAIAILIATVAMIVDAFDMPDELVPHPSLEEVALQMQCDARHGTLAVAHGERMWVECWQGRKKIWGVRL